MDAQERLFSRGDMLGDFLRNASFVSTGEHTNLVMEAFSEPNSAEGGFENRTASTEDVSNGFKRARYECNSMDVCSNVTCLKTITEKNAEIKCNLDKIADLKKQIVEKDIIIEKYRKAEEEDEKIKDIKELEEMLKKVLDKFYKGQLDDSAMYPKDEDVLKCLSYLVKTYCEHPLKAMKNIQNDKIRYKFLKRSKRNRIKRLVKEGYEKSGNKIKLEEMSNTLWHYEGKMPFNHEGILAGARNAFQSNGSILNMFTMSQICFAAAVVELTVKGISLSDKRNIDELKRATEEHYENLIESVNELEIQKKIRRNGNLIYVGELIVVRGTQKVLDSIKLDPTFWDAGSSNAPSD